MKMALNYFDGNESKSSNVSVINQSEMDNSQSQEIGIYIDNPSDMKYPWNINPGFVPIITTHAITFLIGLIGNCVVIITWAGRGRLRSPTAAFLVSLAIADLLLLIVYVPLEMTQYFIVTWDSNGTVCKLTSYVEMLSGIASVLNLVAVSFERFFVIVYPIRARRLCTMSKSRKGLVIVWMSSIFLATPVLVTKEIHPITYYNNVTSVTAYYCWDDDGFNGLCVAIYQLFIMFIIPAILMLFCYFCVIQELWSSTKVISNMTLNAQRNSSNEQSLSMVFVESNGGRTMTSTVNPNTAAGTQSVYRKFCHSYRRNGSGVKRVRKQVIKMLLFVIIVFLLCWGPRLIMNVVIKFGISSFDNYTYTTRVTCNLLSFVHSALNPFVYGFMSSSFRQMMINSCNPGRAANAHSAHMNLDPLANHHIIGCVNINHLLNKHNKQRRSSDVYDPNVTGTGTSNITIPLTINLNGLNSPLNTSPSSSRMMRVL